MHLSPSNDGDFARVPAPLLEHFGKPGVATKLTLNADRRLGHFATDELPSQLQRRGWYLQTPPAGAFGSGAC